MTAITERYPGLVSQGIRAGYVIGDLSTVLIEMDSTQRHPAPQARCHLSDTLPRPQKPRSRGRQSGSPRGLGLALPWSWCGIAGPVALARAAGSVRGVAEDRTKLFGFFREAGRFQQTDEILDYLDFPFVPQTLESASDRASTFPWVG